MIKWMAVVMCLGLLAMAVMPLAVGDAFYAYGMYSAYRSAAGGDSLWALVTMLGTQAGLYWAILGAANPQ